MLDIVGKLTMGAGSEIGNAGSDYSITENGISLDATQQGLKTPPGNIADPFAVRWEGASIEAGRITGYLEDATPTLEDARLGLTAGEGDGLIYMDSDVHFRQLSIQEEETRSISSGGEQALTVGAPVVALSTTNNPRICRIDLSGLSPTIDGAYTIVVVNRGSSSFFWKDESAASLAGANVKTAGGTEREHQPGGRMPVTFWNGNYYVNQDRN